MEGDSATPDPPIPQTQHGNGAVGGTKRRRIPVQDPDNVYEAIQFHTGKRVMSYDISELVLSSSERPAQRYPLLDQSFCGEGGLDFELLRKGSAHCLEMLLKDVYTRHKALDQKHLALGKAYEDSLRQIEYLNTHLAYVIDHYASLQTSLCNLLESKSQLDVFLAQFRGMEYPMNARHPDVEATVPAGEHGATDTQADAPPTDDPSALSNGQGSSDNQLEKLRIHILGKGMVKVQVSPSSCVEKPLHGMHIQPLETNLDIDEGLYYFQREFLDILNTILPKRFKVSSLGAWNYAMRNIRTEILRSAIGDDTPEAREAKSLAKGSKGVILLTHNTVKDVLGNLTERIQDEQKWERVPDKVKKQKALMEKADSLITELENTIGDFNSLVINNREVLVT